MFGKRKYDRKKGNRKTFRRRTRKKNKVLKPADPFPTIMEKPAFDASGSSSYLWVHIPPLNQRQLNETNNIKCGNFTGSLREKCAEIVGANADAISPSYLEEGSWSCWQAVWLSILKNGADLPELFRAFAQQFGDQLTFPCHSAVNAHMSLVYSSLNKLRNTALNACLIPVHRKHRVENVFSNISIHDFVVFVGGLKLASVVIDASKMPSFSAAEVLSLCNIQTIKGLDLSGNRQIGDQLLYTLKSRIVSRNSSLQILILSGCPHISEDGLFSLLQDSGSSNLLYVESDIRLGSLSGFDKLLSVSNDADRIDIVTGTNWKVVHNEDQMGTAAKYKLGLKYHLLLRQMSVVETPGILWDLKFFASALDPRNKDAEDLHCTAWKQRYLGAIQKPLDPPYVYIKDTNIKVTPRVSPVHTVDGPPIFERAGDVVPIKRQNPKKPKIVNTNTQAFFFEE